MNLVEKINSQIQQDPLDKKAFVKQFYEKTELLGIKHTFDVEEAWEIGCEIKRRNAFRKKANEVQENLLKKDNFTDETDLIKKHNPVKELSADGLYLREIFNPANELIITKIHAEEHFYFLLSGEMSILTHDGIENITGPHYGITKPGTKRFIYTYTPCVFVTVHSTRGRDVKDMEDLMTAEDFDDPRVALEDIKLIQKIKKLL
jgi:hypothetical protein